MTISVEYNQLDALLKASGFLDGELFLCGHAEFASQCDGRTQLALRPT
jgi:hypothetical protein